MGESQKILQVRSARQVPVRVRLLDDDIFNHSVDKRAVGWVLFDKVCEHLNIIERDYFGLDFYNAAGEKEWVNNDKKIAKQLKGQNWDFNFEVKFYPADPAQLAEDLTRYQLCLQIRRDIVNEKLPCSFVTYTLLGSYTAQSEVGDYDTEEFGSGYKYLKDIQFAPHQDKELLVKIAELHRQHKGETPEEAELHFLENAKKLAMYGVELHAAKDAEGRDIQLGVCASGLIVYKDKQQINRFVWPKVLKMSYRRNKFYIKIRPGEFETFASLIGFKLGNVKHAKRLWKICVEHHSFFRFREPETPKTVSFLPRFGSRFRYSGRTQFQTRQVVAEENRDSPYFDRVLSKRGTFGGRTQNMKKRDEERQQRRDDMRRQPPPQTKLPPSETRKEPPEPTRPPPEPKHAPPVAPKPDKPKPSPRGPPSVDDNASLDREHTGSLNDSFDDVPDRKSRLEKMHAVATPLAALMQAKKEHDEHEEEHHREEAQHRRDHHQRDNSHDDDHDRSYEHEEHDSRPMTPEVIDQDYTVLPAHRPQSAMSDKEKKAFAKQEKERIKREKEEDRRRKKEEEKERKRLEKEKKALLAEEKKAAKQKSKLKGKDKKDAEKDVRERRDSRGSNDMGRDWDNVRSQDEHGPVTPDRTRKRLSSFEDVKHSSFKGKEVDAEEDRPPTPPAPLPIGARGDDRSQSDSEYDSEDDERKDPRRGEPDDEEDAEEVSF